MLPGVCQGRGGVEFRNKTKSVAKVAKVLGESKHNLNSHRGHTEEVSCHFDLHLFVYILTYEVMLK